LPDKCGRRLGGDLGTASLNFPLVWMGIKKH